MGFANPVLVNVSLRDPVKLYTLQNIYDAMILYHQPAVEQSRMVSPVTALGPQVTSLSTSWVEVTPNLSVTLSTDGNHGVFISCPVFLIVGTVSTHAQFGILVDGVIDPNSILDIISTASVLVVSGRSSQYTHYINSLSEGQHTFQPAIQVVSGASGSITVGYSPFNRTVVSEI